MIADSEKTTENLLKALATGQVVDIIADRITHEEKEHDEHSLQLLLEISQHPVPSMEGIRFFLNQFRKGDINDPKYRHGLVEMLVNKIYLYDEKMTVLRNTQDGHYAEHAVPRAAVPGIGGHDRLAVGLYAAVSWLQRRNMTAASAQVTSA